jgi:hypothetical protein
MSERERQREQFEAWARSIGMDGAGGGVMAFGSAAWQASRRIALADAEGIARAGFNRADNGDEIADAIRALSDDAGDGA